VGWCLNPVAEFLRPGAEKENRATAGRCSNNILLSASHALHGIALDPGSANRNSNA
jgi:hypothetical protein